MADKHMIGIELAASGLPTGHSQKPNWRTNAETGTWVQSEQSSPSNLTCLGTRTWPYGKACGGRSDLPTQQGWGWKGWSTPQLPRVTRIPVQPCSRNTTIFCVLPSQVLFSLLSDKMLTTIAGCTSLGQVPLGHHGFGQFQNWSNPLEGSGHPM